MNRSSNRALLDTLAGEGLWDTDRDGAASERLETHLMHEAPHPWYIRLLASAGAWGTAISVTGLMGLLGFLDEEVFCVLLGAVVLGASVVLRRVIGDTHRTFPVQLALAGAVTGQLLFLGGMVEIVNDESVLLVAAVMYAVLVVAYPDRLGRFLATFGCCLSLGFWIYDVIPDVPMHLLASLIFPAAVWLMDAEASLERGPLAEARAPVAHGLLGSMFGLLIFALIDRNTQGQLIWFTSIGLTAGALFLAYRVREALPAGDRPGPSRTAVLLGGLAVLGALTWSVPGIIVAIGTLVLGFHRRDRVVAGAACLFLTGFLIFFYYDMDMSLLTKSFVLIASGGGLLGARYLIREPDERLDPLEVFQ